MVKSVGWLKKLKKIGDTIGSGASWINKNIIKPLNPLIDTALDFIPGGSAIKTVKNTVSTGLDYLDQNVFKTKDNKKIQNLVNNTKDFILDTQRLPSENKRYPKLF